MDTVPAVTLLLLAALMQHDTGSHSRCPSWCGSHSGGDDSVKCLVSLVKVSITKGGAEIT